MYAGRRYSKSRQKPEGTSHAWLFVSANTHVECQTRLLSAMPHVGNPHHLVPKTHCQEHSQNEIKRGAQQSAPACCQTTCQLPGGAVAAHRREGGATTTTTSSLLRLASSADSSTTWSELWSATRLDLIDKHGTCPSCVHTAGDALSLAELPALHNSGCRQVSTMAVCIPIAVTASPFLPSMTAYPALTTQTMLPS